jgi:hypothetical protein
MSRYNLTCEPREFHIAFLFDLFLYVTVHSLLLRKEMRAIR